MLADFVGLNELLIETAKWEYRQDYPERKNSPHGFVKGLRLKVTGIEDGSAKPVIKLFTVAATLFSAASTAPARAPADYTIYMERARERVIDTIGAATTDGKTLPLPSHLSAHFDRFGRSLEDGEAFGFREGPDGQPTVRLDKPTRRKLLLASPEIEIVTDATKLRGLVPITDQIKNTFEMLLVDGRKVIGPLTPKHRDDKPASIFRGRPTGRSWPS